MNTTPTPPPAPSPTLQNPPLAAGPRRSAPRVIALLSAIAGGALILGTAGSAVASTVAGGSVDTSDLTTAVAGVSSIEVRSSAADLDVSFDDVATATLTVTGPRGANDWELSRDGDRLVVSSDRGWWGGWQFWEGGSSATLVLPEELSGSDADVEVGAGSVRVDGEFAALAVQVDAGSLDVSGSARDLSVTLAAGSAALDVADVRRASVDVDAGRVSGRLSGTAPRLVGIDASAGSVDLGLPAGAYAISADQDAGSFSHSLDEDSSSENRVDVRVEAGSVELTRSR